MSFIEFCCKSGGTNLNAGTRSGTSTEPGVLADFTYTGTFSTNTFTVTPGNPVVSTGSIAVGDYCHVSDDTQPGRLAQVSSVTTGTIVLDGSKTITFNAGTYTRARIGGAWQGPNGTNGFPSSQNNNWYTLTANTKSTRINLKNDQVYTSTSGLSIPSNIIVINEGYSSSYGDGGKASITVGGSGISVAGQIFKNFSVSCNATSGTNPGISVSNGGIITNCIVQLARGPGITTSSSPANILNCEVYNCNVSNTANSAGIVLANFVGGIAQNCISHHNSGSNGNGFYLGHKSMMLNCISHANSGVGVANATNFVGPIFMINCDLYKNNSYGILIGQGSNAGIYTIIQNCNFIKNGNCGVFTSNGINTAPIYVENCGFGTGSMVNTNGAYSGDAIQPINTFIYPSNIHPWVDPDNGNFLNNYGGSRGAGRITFIQTSGYSSIIGYPDLGAVQSKNTKKLIGVGGLIN